jgi:DNA topoisomerase-1
MVSGEGENASTDSSGGEFPRDLGADPKTSEPITLRKGPYGIYVQLGEGKTAKRSGLPKGVDAATVDLAKALSMLALPREVGLHPETGEMIQAGIGRFGPYLLHQKKYTTIPKDDDVLTIGMNRAVTVIAEAANRKPGASAVEVLRDLGKHPESGDDLKILKGRYGPYIKFGKANVTLPKGSDPATVTLEELLPLLPADGKGKGKKKPAKKVAAAKTAAAKPAVKKPAAKAKKPAKKSA